MYKRQVEHRSPKPGVGSSSLSSRANMLEMKKIVAYFKETYDELVHKMCIRDRVPGYRESLHGILHQVRVLEDVYKRQSYIFPSGLSANRAAALSLSLFTSR